MSFSQSQRMADERSSNFGSHATLEAQDQAPNRVPTPRVDSPKAEPRSPTKAQAQAPLPTPATAQTPPSIEIQTDSEVETQNPEYQQTPSYDHSFTGNETEHIKFSAYDPFGGTMTSFGVNLDTEAANFTYPINGKFSSGYGRRGRGNHAGVDLVAPLSTPIYAAFDGVVRLAKPYSGYGNVIVIRHNNGLETVYAHNSRNLVAVGQSVTSGQQIALCGRTGRATTEHLHFEVRIKGQTIDPTLLVDVNEKRLRRGQLIVSRAPSGSVSAKLSVAGVIVEPSEPRVASSEPRVATSEPQIASNQSTTTATTASGMLSTGSEVIEVPPATSSIAPSYQSRGIRVGDQIYDNPPTIDPEPAKPAKPTKPTATSDAKYHTIVGGDTLSGIAQKYHTTVSALCSLNNMTKNSVIRTGKKIRIK